MANVTNLELKGLLEGILGSVVENTAHVRSAIGIVEEKVVAIDTKVIALDTKVSAMDSKLDDIMKQLEKMNKNIASGAGKKQSGFVYYESKEYEFKFACGHTVTMRHKKYVNTQTRCRELDIKFCCPECSKKSAFEKYTDFFAQYDRLPSGEELKDIKAAFKAQRAELSAQYAQLRAEKKAMMEQINYEKKKKFMLETYQIDIESPEYLASLNK